MTRVFVSYAQENRTPVAAFVTALQGARYEVWWDRALHAGADWDKSIESELRRADCVVIFWSEHSVESPWARIEAHYARQHDCLVPVRLDTVEVPDEYRMLQTIDATGAEPASLMPQITDAIDAVRRRQRGLRIKLATRAALGIAVLAGLFALVSNLLTARPSAEIDLSASDLWREMQGATTLEELELVENRFDELAATGKRPVLAYSGLCASSLMRYQLTRRDADLAIAESNCARARELDDGSTFAAEANGWLAFYTGDPEPAAAAFRRSLSLDPNGATAKLGLGAALEALGQSAEAEQVLLESTVSRPGLWRTQNALALFLQRQGRTEESIRRLELALELAPGNVSILNNLGVSHLFNQDYGKAIVAWNQVLEITPPGEHGPTLSNIGSAYYLMHDFAAAKIAYEKASRFVGDDYRIWDNLADTLSALGETAAAKSARGRALDRATLIYSQNSGDLLALASIASAKSALGMEGWRSDIYGALAAPSGDPEIHRIAALCFLRAGDLQEASRQHAKALSLGYPEFMLVADYQFDAIGQPGLHK